MVYYYFSVHGRTLLYKPFSKIVCLSCNLKALPTQTECLIDVINSFAAEYPTITIISINYIMTSKTIIDMPNYIMIEKR